MAYGESNGHVTVDQSPMMSLKGQSRDPNTLRPNILKTATITITRWSATTVRRYGRLS